jgi:tetratricopeptide (TPR) repeat protein
MQQRPTLVSFLIVIVACLLVGVAYWPGRLGPFIFDDAANLPALGEQGPIRDAAAFARYITSGKGDPTGRPIALLSFLANAQDWPANPLPFKLTNIGLHLLNGVLLWSMLLRLGGAFRIPERQRQFAAVLGSLLWLANPLLVSTVLYVVQREAMLPATFTLLALHTWLSGRERLLEGRRSGAIWITAGIGLCTAIATMAKANGLLIPLLIIIADACLPPAADDLTKRYRRLLRIAMLPVIVMVVGWLVLNALQSIGAPVIAVRGWGVGQRLLTEPSVLLDYLARLWLLKPSDGSVFHDDYPVAQGLFEPWYVLPTILVWLAAGVAAWMGRRRVPSLSLAVLFFVGGQLLESTSIPLELYFEHRNYLPSMLMFWPLALLLTRVPQRTLAQSLATLLVAGPLLLTRVGAIAWASPLAQAMEWAAVQPDSPRAQTYAAQIEASYGRVEEAVARIDKAALRFPNELQVALTVVSLHCVTGILDRADLEAVKGVLTTTPRDPGVLLSQWVAPAIETAKEEKCGSLTLESLQDLLDAATRNPAIRALPGRLQDVDHLRGQIALARKDLPAALTAFNAALAKDPTPQAALNQAAMLGAAGDPDKGLAHLDYYETLPPPPLPSPATGMPWLHAVVLTHQGYWPRELAHLRQVLRSDPHRAPHA